MSPALCPNYPYCDDGAIQSLTVAAPTFRWFYFFFDRSEPFPNNVLHHRYPAGFPAALCPNYPYCNDGAVDSLAVADPTRRYPAGFPIANCINYPFCDV